MALGFTTINGLPAHILLVHAVVVFVPVAAIALIVASIRPGAARRLGIWLPALAVVALLAVFAAMNAGGWLQNHVENNALVRRHTDLAGQLWPFSAVVAVLSVVVWWLESRAKRASMTAIVAVLSIVVGLGSIVEVVRIGDSGSKASWHDHFSQTAINR